MTNSLVTIGVPVFRGHDTLPGLLECLRTQSHRDLDILISADAGDEQSAEVCAPFLRQDSRFRLQVQPLRLGWAGNTDWTMRQCHGDFYIYQQHDDLISPTYVADLVEAAAKGPGAVLFFAKLQFTGTREDTITSPSLVGDPISRVLSHLRRFDWVPFRGLIRASALKQTLGLLVSDFDPFDSLGTEHRFLAELALLGEFRFVEGPTYFKSWHGKNLSIKRESWTREHWLKADACFAAWMIEVIAPAGASVAERRRLFKAALQRFTGHGRDPVTWTERTRSALRRGSKALAPLRAVADRLKRSERLRAAVQAPKPFWGLDNISDEERVDLLRQILERLKSGGRFDPAACMGMTWEDLEGRYFGPSA